MTLRGTKRRPVPHSKPLQKTSPLMNFILVAGGGLTHGAHNRVALVKLLLRLFSSYFTTKQRSDSVVSWYGFHFQCSVRLWVCLCVCQHDNT